MSWKSLCEETQPTLIWIHVCNGITFYVVVKRELEAEASAVAGKEKAATAEVCIVQILLSQMTPLRQNLAHSDRLLV